jgi:hypothetical protein
MSRIYRLPPLGALFLTACLFISEDKPAHGGSSDTETLTGIVTGINGTPSIGASIKLLPANYDPSHPDTTKIRKAKTDSMGIFSFDRVDTSKVWNVIAGSTEKKSWAMVQGVKPGKGEQSLNLAMAKTFLISLHSSIYTVQDSGIAYFPGTDILVKCNGVTVSLVDTVPAEALRFIVESRSGWKHDTTFSTSSDTAKIMADSINIRITP